MDSKSVKIKVCLVGDARVGKTSLIRRFIHDQFDKSYIQTIGTRVYRKEVTTVRNDLDLELHADIAIWDIMGHEEFRTLLKEAYFYGASGLIAVCDTTEESSLEDLDAWIKSARSVIGKVPVVLVANKADLHTEARLSKTEVENAMKKHGASCFLTSAKTGEGVKSAFHELANKVIEEKFGKIEFVSPH